MRANLPAISADLVAIALGGAFAMQMSNEEESIVMFLTDDEGIESMAETLEKVASEIRTLKKETQQSIH